MNEILYWMPEIEKLCRSTCLGVKQCLLLCLRNGRKEVDVHSEFTQMWHMKQGIQHSLITARVLIRMK